MSRWRVFRSLSGWWARPANSFGVTDDKSEHFPTHAEALAYADRAARTVEVTLPRIDKAMVHIAGSMSNRDAEALGLTLLTLARRKEQA